MPEAEGGQTAERVLIDAGIFIGALLKGDPRHGEARALVEQARRGALAACTTASILHDARHAAAALNASVVFVYTYDADDWKVFADEGLRIAGPPSTMARLAQG